MARPVRVEFEGAIYHVMARGNERRPIFRDDTDRKRFLDTLAEAVERFGLVVHAYCLMSNHYHLLVETPRANLSQALGWVQTTYTVRFNRRHRRSGHLFQGRFKAQLVDGQTYGKWLVQYVHYNPVRPRDRAEPIPRERKREWEAYPWSSHRDYAGRRTAPKWLRLEWLRLWGKTVSEARAEYARDMDSGFGKPVNSPWEQLRGGLVLGTTALWQKARKLIGRKAAGEEHRWSERHGKQEIRDRVRALVEREADVRIAIWARVRLGGERGVEVAREQGYKDGSGVTQAVKRLEQKASKNKALRTRLDELTNLSIVKR
ncbi:MAG: hypothetical protein AKCLJLPJ_02568 [Fimbriimonadales bacterium]|nr:hypothetical protein [Fimbriimonadales bacterium]